MILKTILFERIEKKRDGSVQARQHRSGFAARLRASSQLNSSFRLSSGDVPNVPPKEARRSEREIQVHAAR